jgi:hypothetical protein
VVDARLSTIVAQCADVRPSDLADIRRARQGFPLRVAFPGAEPGLKIEQP